MTEFVTVSEQQVQDWLLSVAEAHGWKPADILAITFNFETLDSSVTMAGVPSVTMLKARSQR